MGPEFFFRTSFKIAALKWGCPQAPRYSSESSCQVPNDHGFLKWQEAMGHGIFIDIAQICSNNIDSIMDSDLVSKNLCEGISNWYWLFLQNTFPNCWENWEKTPWNSYILGFLQWKYPTKKIQWFGVCTHILGNLHLTRSWLQKQRATRWAPGFLDAALRLRLLATCWGSPFFYHMLHHFLQYVRYSFKRLHPFKDVLYG